ncbi:MAG: DUF3616 domain-containing protein [Verrucomicrobiota bacterium]
MTTWLFGASDASAVVTLDSRHFVVADDEDNVLRVYDRERPGWPTFSWDSSAFLRVDRRSPESDLEGGARVGDRIYWITSHGRSKRAEYRESRHRLFATTIVEGPVGPVLRATGTPYLNLNQDLVNAPRLRSLGLSLASTRAPKAAGAFNIEGLSATPEGQLLIGLRNPVPQGKALLVPLLNPEETVSGRTARLGDPVLLDLGGLGIRSMTWTGDRYLILAGSYDAGGPFRLYEWSGKSAPVKLTSLNLPGLTPEGMDLIPGAPSPTLLMVSDDGTLKIGKKLNKRLKQPQARRFRVLELVL